MPNVHRGEVEIDGTDYVLKYDYNALCEIEDKAGINLPSLLAKMEDGTPPSFSVMRLLVWGGLRSRQPKLTLAQAGVILGDTGVAKIMVYVSKALTASLGEPSGEPAKGE